MASLLLSATWILVDTQLRYLSNYLLLLRTFELPVMHWLRNRSAKVMCHPCKGYVHITSRPRTVCLRLVLFLDYFLNKVKNIQQSPCTRRINNNSAATYCELIQLILNTEVLSGPKPIKTLGFLLSLAPKAVEGLVSAIRLPDC